MTVSQAISSLKAFRSLLAEASKFNSGPIPFQGDVTKPTISPDGTKLLLPIALFREYSDAWATVYADLGGNYAPKCPGLQSPFAVNAELGTDSIDALLKCAGSNAWVWWVGGAVVIGAGVLFLARR